MTNYWSAREQVEIFHLLFLRSLFSRLDDKSLVSVKGGCNLRFFFASPRYSEDLDLDARVIHPTTLAGKVEKIFTDGALGRLLTAKQLRITRSSVAKQTETVLRWKAAIAGPDQIETPTKIEFSHRETTSGVFEQVPEAILDRYELPRPILLTHYAADHAAAQKIQALVGRDVPQVRDVFDLNRLHGLGAKFPPMSKVKKAKAIERALGFTYDEFQSRVVAYLETDEQSAYDGPKAWEAIQLAVVEALEAAPLEGD